MSQPTEFAREGSLEAPTRHPLDWQSEDFWSEESLNKELERVYDICHGCRRCVSLCESFPVLFDLVDESPTMEVDGVDKADYRKVVDQCYLCDLCYQTKCPYVPPHEWNIDFPHLMLRAKAIYYKQKKPPLKHRILASTTAVGKLASIPVVAQTVNAANRAPSMRKALEKTLGVHRDACVPEYHSDTFRRRMKKHQAPAIEAREAAPTRGKVALFATCYCNVNTPDIASDLVKVLEHNGIPVVLAAKETCCGMPRYEQGNLEAVTKAKNQNIPELARLVDEGYDLIAAIPSCVLMFKQELPLMFPQDEQVQKVKAHFYDPFEYLALRHKAGLLNTEFKTGLGQVAWHVACHQRVQNIGGKTKEILSLAPDTEITPVERCSGHDGTYGVKTETHALSKKIARGTVSRIKRKPFDYFVSDCPMAATHLAEELEMKNPQTNPITLLRMAYGLS
ncbi:heterodisulfide reductase-related iron-sulfur binding cluster [Wenzhouxiangella marina]|uniref:Fe-S oxidoreductase n=1 Tax=Wenzhouxiangella marina TaxID=1579979 RepID=A0A0K0XSD4_9GAMM|nr:heterodisulfide reductase-related iron-sulfur binding cluster [Wenzhouxiangella marina]AKS40570.1 Fe-S oxidoreductase [Wenzhouxiangella marina]MBB6088338.1 Fe-S oxidoreductase [Wenzhouxiangella marina]